MGKKAKGSRKGKKAWRANISTEDIDDYFEKSTKDALSGGPLTELPSESLFFVDKSSGTAIPLSYFSSSIIPRLDGVSDSGMVDIWDDEGFSSFVAVIMLNPAFIMRWHSLNTVSLSFFQKSKPSIIPAVEVEPPGCSFNPAFESHQDSLACAVADEMQKIYRHELGPQPIPFMVPGEVVDEEDAYFLEVDNGSDDDQQNIENKDENGDNVHEKRPSITKKVTRVELNKRARRKEKLKTEAEAKKVEQFSKEIDSLPDIIQEIAKDDEEKQRRHLRRLVAKQERLKSRPPRLGRHKFEPAPVQVLLSEEITGSLRKLKGCSTLARDRFKSLEKRGLVVPSAKSGRK
ncbi:hypothetical protein RHGRI_027693 [Rhododendron griersonianum]|uniref:Ribosome biogenesis protein NOP53 n=1 Tax=Rhododendron griersonianum TaxID=479676 RepID=A0AAV6IXM8_9ERIC|nr:hypothetical protein RHGRI_027693 [Rhododendron griersonianum]